jgi:hypothetical protein
MSLAPCTACARHVRRTETRCPFCGAAVAFASPARGPSERLGRAALFAFGTAVATSAIGCGTKTNLGVGAGEVIDSAVDRDAGGVPVLYGGAPPPDAGPDLGCCNADYGGPPIRDDAGTATDASTSTDAGTDPLVDVGVDADFTALYGAPPPPPPPPDEL